MSMCDRCIHNKVCGSEGTFDPAMTYCSDFMGWIPVSERLPEDGTYLVTIGIIEPTVQIMSFAEDLYKVDEFDFCDKKCQCGWYVYDGDGYLRNTGVIAWMPLPEPYKAEGEDKE